MAEPKLPPPIIAIRLLIFIALLKDNDSPQSTVHGRQTDFPGGDFLILMLKLRQKMLSACCGPWTVDGGLAPIFTFYLCRIA